MQKASSEADASLYDAEKTPLLARPAATCGVPAFFKHWNAWNKVKALPILAVRWHGLGILFSILSALACYSLGYATFNIFDPLIFKSIFVVCGFALGFRNVRAGQRHFDVLNYFKLLFGSAWSIIALVPDEARPRVAEALVQLIDAFLDHIKLIASRRSYWLAIVGLQPSPRSASQFAEAGPFGFVSEVEANLSPRTLLVATMLLCEQAVEQMDIHPSTRHKRVFWEQRQSFQLAWDFIEGLALPSVSDRYVLLIDACLFLFAVALPWGISVHSVTVDMGYSFGGTWHLGTASCLVLNTLICTLVLFGLNALAQEQEDPFSAHGADGEVDLHMLSEAFKAGVRGYEARREIAQTQLAQTGEIEKGDVAACKAQTEARVALHALICGDHSALRVEHTLLSCNKLPSP